MVLGHSEAIFSKYQLRTFPMNLVHPACHLESAGSCKSWRCVIWHIQIEMRQPFLRSDLRIHIGVV